MLPKIIVSKFTHSIVSGTIYGRDFFVFGISFNNDRLCERFKELGFYIEKGDILATKEITEYLDMKRKFFTVNPVLLWGTPFQKRVWGMLRQIPFGKFVTYENLAVTLGNPRGARAIGQALSKNPIPIIIPCHRVLGKKGLGGFTGGIHIKKRLLEIEGICY